MAVTEPDEVVTPDAVLPPKPRKKPKDHLKPAAQREAEGDDVAEIEFGGETYEIPTDTNKLPLRAIRALENQQGITFVEYVLGAEQFELMLRKFRREHGREMTAEDIDGLADDIAVALGFKTVGE